MSREADEGTPAAAPLHVPPLPPALVLAAALVAISWAGPLIRLSDAPSLVIAAWRLVFSVAFIAVVVALGGGGHGLRTLPARDWALGAAAGVLLAGHFWTWIASISLTTIASSVVLVSSQPIFVALLSVAFLGERPRPREWVGIGLGVVGAGVIGWGDFGRGADALLGDLLAVAGAVLVSGYYVIGRRLRQSLDLWAYTGLVYGCAAVVLLLAAALSPGVALTGYPPREWLLFLLLAAGPMMVGHTGVNYALRYVRAYVANLVLLAEPVGATIIAWALPWIREAPPPQTVLGGAFLLAGILLGTSRLRSRRPPAAAAGGGEPTEAADGGEFAGDTDGSGPAGDRDGDEPVGNVDSGEPAGEADEGGTGDRPAADDRFPHGGAHQKGGN